MCQSEGGDPNATRERFEGDTQERSWDANVKRTYDETGRTYLDYQDLQLTAARRSQSLFDAGREQGLAHSGQINSIVTQALQNAVETANMVAKQAVAHRDVGNDRTWNLDEVSHITGGSAVSVAAIAAAAAVAAVKEFGKAESA